MSLLKSILKRLLSSVVVLLGLTVIIFILMRMVPGDPARLALGANVTEEVLENYREVNHLNDPLPLQYIYWLTDALRGDFGMSAVTKRAVIQDIMDFAPATIELVIWAGFPPILAALFLGVTSAQHKNKWQDYLSRFLGYIFVATPTFVFAVLFVLIFGYWLPVMPTIGGAAEPVLHNTGYHRPVYGRRPFRRAAGSSLGCIPAPFVPGVGAGSGKDDAGGKDHAFKHAAERG